MNEKTQEIAAHELLEDLSFCVFDLETTGGDQKNDKIIEIGMVKIEKLKIVKKKNYLISPEIKIPQFIQKLTTIHERDVKNAPTIEQVIDDIIEFMGDSILVAHNASFDIPFFNSVLERLGRPVLKNKTICTNLMTKYLIPNLLNSNLQYMSTIFDIPHQNAHRAMDDARAASMLLLKYLSIFKDKKIQKLNHMYYPRNRYELDRIIFKKDQEQELAETLKKISKINAPYLISAKGEEGVIVWAMPGNNLLKEQSHIESALKKYSWKNLSIRIYGHFCEALIHFNEFCNKLDPIIRNETISFLSEIHLTKKLKKETTSDKVTAMFNNADFIILPHLIPQQCVIYPLTTLHPSQALVFRPLTQQKRLLQYLKSKALKIQNNQLKRIYFSPILLDFINMYLQNELTTNQTALLIKKSHPIKNKDIFLKELAIFAEEKISSVNFPTQHL